jgi:hypothetical protein
MSIGDHWGNLPSQINSIKRGETDSEYGGGANRGREKERFLSVNDQRRTGRDSETMSGQKGLNLTRLHSLEQYDTNSGQQPSFMGTQPGRESLRQNYFGGNQANNREMVVHGQNHDQERLMGMLQELF